MGASPDERGEETPLRAVLFDLDGTLYHQAPVRKRMALELVRFMLRSPLRGPRTVRGLRHFRHIREDLRDLGQATESLEELQYRAPATRAGLDAVRLRLDVEEWMIRRPLPFVAANARADMAPSLERLAGMGVRIGVFSDYPVADKLAALSCRSHFSVELCATDTDVNAFKPHPRGFLRACERWDLLPSEVLFVGDRADVDAGGARAAGMPCALVGGERHPEASSHASLEEVVAAYFPRFASGS
jgi:HAD superfamily hydrolase (TIGR01549 family)